MTTTRSDRSARSGVRVMVTAAKSRSLTEWMKKCRSVRSDTTDTYTEICQFIQKWFTFQNKVMVKDK